MFLNCHWFGASTNLWFARSRRPLPKSIIDTTSHRVLSILRYDGLSKWVFYVDIWWIIEIEGLGVLTICWESVWVTFTILVSWLLATMLVLWSGEARSQLRHLALCSNVAVVMPTCLRLWPKCYRIAILISPRRQALLHLLQIRVVLHTWPMLLEHDTMRRQITARLALKWWLYLIHRDRLVDQHVPL